MENMRLEITVNSASDLDGVRALGEPRVYVVVFLSNNQAAQHKTQIDEIGKTNPTWNSTMSFSVSETELHSNHNLCVVFQLHDRRTLGGDQCLGEVRVPLKDLFNKASSTNPKYVIYPVIMPNNSPKGLLIFSYRFHELASVAPNPQLQTQVYRKTVKYPQQQMPPQQYSAHALASVTANRQSYSMQNQGNYTPINNPRPNQYSMLPPHPTRYYNTISQQVPYQPNAQPPKSKSESYMKIGLMIGAGSLITGIGSLATNAVAIGTRKDKGGGGGGEDFGSGAVDPSTENRVENHNMGLDPSDGFQDPNTGLDSGIGFQDPHMGLDSGIGFQDSNMGLDSGIGFQDSNMGLDSGMWFQDPRMGLDSSVSLDSNVGFQDSNMGLDSGVWFQDPHMGLDSGIGFEVPNAVFGFGDNPWVGHLNMVPNQSPSNPDSSVLFVDQPFVPDTSSGFISEFSGFIG